MTYYLRRQSKKRQVIEKELRKIEKELDGDPRNHWCFFFPQLPKCEYHHLVPKSQSTLLIASRENLIPVSRKAHDILTHGKLEDIKKLPHLDKMLERIKKLDEGYYNRLKLKFDS